MPTLTFPNGREAVFPDGTSDEVISSSLDQAFIQFGPEFFTDPFSPIGEAKAVEERSVFTRDLQSGAAQFIQDAGTIARITGEAGTEFITPMAGIPTELLARTGKRIEEFGESLQPKFSVEEAAELNESVVDKFREEGLGSAIKLAFTPRRLGRQLTQLAPSIASTIAAGAATGGVGAVALGGSALSAGARRQAVKGLVALGAGTVGGLQEGAGTARETEQLGGPAGVAFANAIITTAGVTVLNAIGVRGALSRLPKGFAKKVGQVFLAGGNEAVTEFLEEPFQAGILAAEGFDIDFIERSLQGLNVGPPAFLAGMIGGGAANLIQSLGEAKPDVVEALRGVDVGQTGLLSEKEIQELSFTAKRFKAGTPGQPFTQGFLGLIRGEIESIPLEQRVDRENTIDRLLDPEDDLSLKPNLRGVLTRLANARNKADPTAEATQRTILEAIVDTPIDEAQRKGLRKFFGQVEEIGTGVFSTETEQDLVRFVQERRAQGAELRALRAERRGRPKFRFTAAENALITDRFQLKGMERKLFIRLAEIAFSNTAASNGLDPRAFFEQFVEPGDGPSPFTQVEETVRTEPGEGALLTPDAQPTTAVVPKSTTQEAIERQAREQGIELPGVLIEPAATAAPGAPPSLPNRLSAISPSIRLGRNKNFALEFESDLDKAAYVVSQEKPGFDASPYVNFVSDALGGRTTEEVSALGASVTAAVRDLAKETPNSVESITVEPILDTKTGELLQIERRMEPKGSILFELDDAGELASRVLFRGLTDPDFSTAIHELNHFIALTAQGELKLAIEQGMAHKTGNKTVARWTVDDHEYFAMAGEMYFLTGSVPNKGMESLFEMIRELLEPIIARARQVIGNVIPKDLDRTFMMIFDSEGILKGTEEQLGWRKRTFAQLNQLNQDGGTFGPKQKNISPQIPVGLPDSIFDVLFEGLGEVEKGTTTTSEMMMKAWNIVKDRKEFFKVKERVKLDPARATDIEILSLYTSLITQSGALDALLSHKDAAVAQIAYDTLLNDLGPALHNAASAAGRRLYAVKVGLAQTNLLEAFLALGPKMTDAQLSELMQLDWTNLAKVKEFQERLKGFSKKNFFLAMWFNSLLSNPKTWFFTGINAIGNLGWGSYNVGTRPHIILLDKLFARLEGRKDARKLFFGPGGKWFEGEAVQLFTTYSRGLIANLPIGKYLESLVQIDRVKKLERPTGKQAFVKALKLEEFADDDTAFGDAIGRLNMNAFAELARRGVIRMGTAQVLSTPSSFLKGMDLWFKAIVRVSEEEATMSRVNSLEGAERQNLIDSFMAEEEAITGRDFRVIEDAYLERIRKTKDITPKELDAVNNLRLVNLIEFRARRFARFLTFQDKPGDATAKVLSLVREDVDDFFLGFPIGTIMFPFIRIASRLSARAAEFMPGLGIVEAFITPRVINPEAPVSQQKVAGHGMFARLRISNTDYRKLTPQRRAEFLSRLRPEATARQVEGLIIVLIIGNLFSRGLIRGAPPEDEAEREAAFRVGKLPYTIGSDEPGATVVEYRRFEPFGTVLAMLVDAMQEKQEFFKDLADPANPLQDEDTFEQGYQLFIRLANRVVKTGLDTTFMQSFLNFTTTEKALENALARTASAFVPYSGFMRTMHRQYQAISAADPKIPLEERTFMSVVGEPLAVVTDIGQLIGIEKKMKPRLNAFGEPITRDVGKFGFKEWLPFRFQTIEDDPVENWIQAIGYYPRPPQRVFEFRGVKRRFDEDIYTEFVTKSGIRGKDILLKMVKTVSFTTQPKERQLDRIRKEMDKIKDSERKTAKEKQILRERERINL